VPARRPAGPPPSRPAAPLRPGAVVRLEVEDLAFGEDAVGRHGGYVVFVQGALPGEVIEARVTEAGRKYGRADLLRVLEPSPARVEPRCRHFGTCGGCTWQHLRYDAQARTKEDLLRRLLGARVSAAAAAAVAPIVRTEPPWGFREKVQLAVQGRPGAPRLGFYRPRTREVVDIAECPVQPPEAVAQALELKRILARRRVPPWEGPGGRPGLRHVVLRRGRATGDAHVVLVTSPGRVPGLEDAVEDIKAMAPAVSGASLNIQEGDTPMVLGEETRPLFGHRGWRERIGGAEYLVGPVSFFQTNAAAAATLAEEVLRAAEGRWRRALDLYAGVGLFAVALARRIPDVVAVEGNPHAARDGRRNAERAGLARCRWIATPVERAVADPELGRFDFVVADPPREGLAPGVLRGIVRACGARRLVLVSCDPMTLARDLAEAESLGGRVVRVLPVDMFPHTHHLESVATVDFPATTRPAPPRDPGGPRRPAGPGPGGRR
jgi:23S rRNA (uracil1939-C5)-methyltransferase